MAIDLETAQFYAGPFDGSRLDSPRPNKNRWQVKAFRDGRTAVIIQDPFHGNSTHVYIGPTDENTWLYVGEFTKDQDWMAGREE